MDKIKQMLGLRIKEVIKQSSYTQKEIAQKLDISENGLSNYITGKRVPDALLVAQFAQLCNININWLLLGVGEMFLSSKNNGIPVKEAETHHDVEAMRRELQLLRKENRKLRNDFANLSSGANQQKTELSLLMEEIQKIKEKLNPTEKD